MTTRQAADGFRERLIPGPWLFVAFLLIIPAVALVVTPLNSAIALAVAVVAYLIAAASLIVFAPVVEVARGELLAGRARIPVSLLGDVEVLNPDQLRAAIGPGADARAYLMLRGYIHGGIKVLLDDNDDPTPYWIVTTRRPRTLARAIEDAKAAEVRDRAE